MHRWNFQSQNLGQCNCSIQSQAVHQSNIIILVLPEERCSQLRLNRLSFLIFLLPKIMLYFDFLHILIITFLYCCIFCLELSIMFHFWFLRLKIHISQDITNVSFLLTYSVYYPESSSFYYLKTLFLEPTFSIVI